MTYIELVCPAGNLPCLQAAVDNGADAVYLGFRDGTNARNFAGLNFSADEITTAIAYAHKRDVRVFLALNTYPSPANWGHWCKALDTAAALGVDAVILADPGLMRYGATRHPDLRLHLSVQGSATNHEAIDFYVREFNVRRVVLPRVLSATQVRAVVARVNAEVEVFGFGSLCIMVEGRCTLSSYVTGESPNVNGVCSPAKAVRWQETAHGRSARLNGVLIDVYRDGENAGYPQLCKGRFEVEKKTFYALEEPTSLNVLDILPQLIRAGVAAIKVEGRQRSPAYVAQVTRTLREALDACVANPDRYIPRREWIAALDRIAEGGCHTLGAYHRPWQ
jgi:collagenase-like PrtC family protease